MISPSTQDFKPLRRKVPFKLCSILFKTRRPLGVNLGRLWLIIIYDKCILCHMCAIVALLYWFYWLYSPKWLFKRTQHVGPTLCNIVGCNMLRSFKHHVAWCCMMLHDVGSHLTWFKHFIQHLTIRRFFHGDVSHFLKNIVKNIILIFKMAECRFWEWERNY